MNIRAPLKILLVVSVFLLIYHVSIASQAVFYRDLSIGMNGSDIKELQRLLNHDPETEVSITGPGSSGNETMYFGAKTAKAVTKFQEKYANEILTPVGLYYGTGYVGYMTRQKLEKYRTEHFDTLSAIPTPSPTNSPRIVNQSQTVAPVLSTTYDNSLQSQLSRGVVPQSAAFGSLNQSDLMVFGISHTKIKPGDYLNIIGLGFDSDTFVHFGTASSVRMVATSSRDIKVQIPSIPYGTYQVWVSNAKGSTENTAKYYVVIGTETDVLPEIISVNPIRATRNDIITIKADKLDTSSNTIYSTLGIIRNISSADGKTLTVRVSDFPKATQFSQNQSVNEFTVSFSIGTKSGRSINYGYFIITK